MNHLCMENDTIGTLGECKIYYGREYWCISVDCGCCHTEINFCPYCGVNLRLKQIVVKLGSEGK